MSLRKSLQSLSILPGILLPGVLIFASLQPQLSAQSYPDWRVSITFPPTQNRGAPGRTIGGGTRSPSCLDIHDTALTALMPENDLGLTVSANPTFFFYVPKATETLAELSVEFTVSDEESKEIYHTNFTLVNTPGVVKVQLPETVSLEIGKTYNWQFAMICNSQEPERDQFVWGKSQRVEFSPELKANLKQILLLEQAKLYAHRQIWHETLGILAELHSSHPREWEELLDSVGLEEIAKKPLVECCTVENKQKLNE